MQTMEKRRLWESFLPSIIRMLIQEQGTITIYAIYYLHALHTHTNSLLERSTAATNNRMMIIVRLKCYESHLTKNIPPAHYREITRRTWDRLPKVEFKDRFKSERNAAFTVCASLGFVPFSRIT